MKPLKVLILITKSNWGGAQRYVFDLATNLPRDRYEVKVMAGGGGILIDKLQAAGIAANGDLPIGRDISLFQDIKAFFKLLKILRTEKPDVLHVNSSKIGGLGTLSGRLAGVPRIIFTSHGWAWNESRPLWQKFLIGGLYWLTLVFAHETIVVSAAAKKQARFLPFVQNKMTIIHNGLSPSAGFSRANARLELTRRHEALKEAVAGVSESHLIWVGTIAELHHIKGYRYAIEAIGRLVEMLSERHPHLKLVYTMIGDGEERARLEQQINEAGLADKVFLLGAVDQAAEFLKAFDIFLLASLSEGLAYVIIEAGAAGAPVVATAVGGIPEVVSDMSSGILVQPRNARELAHALDFFIEHPMERKAYGATLRSKVAESFTLKEMVERTAQIYRINNATPRETTPSENS